jgi:endonuclease/exonuclease/phosphatase (EEP) superfamily protein YafD
VPPLRRLLPTALLVALLAPALLLTGLRLMQPTAGWAVRSVSFAPFALPLYLAGCTLLVGLVVRAARDRAWPAFAKRLAALVGVGVLVLLHVTWLLPWFTGQPPAEAEGAPRLRVLTLNVLHDDGATGADVARAVAEARADVVVLQEVTAELWRELGDSGVRRSHPATTGLPQQELPGTVVLSRLPIGRAEQLDTVGHSLAVPVRLGERSVELLAAHPRYPRYPNAWREDHAAIAAAVRRSRPALLVGDFNATYDHVVLRRYRDLGYRSADELRNTGWRPTWPANGQRTVMGIPVPRVVQIDHVMVSRRLTATDVEHLHVPRSDHRAVVAEVTLR